MLFIVADLIYNVLITFINMTKLITIGLITFPPLPFLRIVKNVTIFKEHSCITVVEQLIPLHQKADTVGIAGFYAESVTFYDAPLVKHPYKLAEEKKGVVEGATGAAADNASVSITGGSRFSGISSWSRSCQKGQ